MDGTAHAIMQLDIELGKHVGVEDACFRYVPDSSGFYNVPNDKLLDGLILGHAPGAVRAANGLHMAAALFGATVVSSFESWLQDDQKKKKQRSRQKGPRPCAAHSLHELRPVRAQG